MKKVLITAACALALAGLSASKANALTLTIGDEYYLGSINDGIPPSETLEAGYINYLITLAPGADDTQLPPGTGEIYNREGSTISDPLPTALAPDAFKDDSGNYTSIDVTGYTYLLAKYDQETAGSLVWLVSGLGTVDVVSQFNDRDLSHYTLFNADDEGDHGVPDGGTSMGLLGVGLLGLGYLRQRVA
jgi:hypothetical protein